MFTVEPQIRDLTPVTLNELDTQLNIKLKQLQTQIKNDVQNEMMQMVHEKSTFLKAMEGLMATTLETTLAKFHAEEKERRTKIAKIRRRRKTQMVQQTRLKVQALRKGTTYIAALEDDTPQQEHLEARVAADVTGSDPEGNGLPLITVITERTQSREFRANGLYMSLISRLVLSPSFELGISMLVILNMVLIGFETQAQSSSNATSKTRTGMMSFLDMFFCVLFTLELCFRISVYRFQTWYNDYLFQSTAFDATMVALQIVDQVASACNLNMRALSILRVFRILRSMRLVHLVDELSALIVGMTNSLRSMVWASFLLALLMYMFSIVIMQILITSGDMHAHSEIDRWFGSVDRAVCTMFEISVGGRPWSEVLQVLTYEVNPLMGLIIVSYIVISLVLLTNLVCGVFADGVAKTVRDDKDEKQAARLSDHFTKKGSDGEEIEVTLEDFREKLSTDDAIRSYFTSIDVNPDPANAKVIFDLIDVDGSGHLSGAEIAGGCLRLRGTAKALELAMLSSDVSQICRLVSTSIAASEKVTRDISRVLAAVEAISGRSMLNSIMDDSVMDSVMDCDVKSDENEE